MAESITYYAVLDQNNASNGSLNVRGDDPVLTFMFRSSGPTGDLILEQAPDDSDADTLPEIDPDTKIVINNVEYDFAVILTGNLPTTPPGSNRTPTELQGKEVMLIKIDLDGNGLDANDPQYFFVLDGSGTFVLMDAFTTGAVQLSLTNTTPPNEPVCFCAGTEIATPIGPRAVESLRPGDSVLTDDGRSVQVAWVGISAYSDAQLARDPSVRPVRIPAHAFGPGLPMRDLDLSPQHRVVVEGSACELLFGMPRAFVVARNLLGTVAHTPDTDGGVKYVHLMLDNHEILVGNGLPSESYQPARRMLDIMTGDNLDRLMAALEVLGTDAMLTRPDALPTLSSREARVLTDTIIRQNPMAGLPKAGARGATAAT